MRRFAVLLAAAALLAIPQLAPAADPRFPDWPCVQAKVPELSIAAMWSGPAIDDVGNAWETDPATRDRIARLAARRTPLDEAQKAIGEFVSGGPEEKQTKAKLLFAGLFETLNRQRSEVISGIERFTRRQRELVERIRANTLRMRELESAADREQGKVAELANQVEWDTRIFEDRRKSTRYVCEVPTIIEQRLFALGRAIQQALE